MVKTECPNCGGKVMINMSNNSEHCEDCDWVGEKWVGSEGFAFTGIL
jgi:ribosomal protein S27AE